MFEKGKKVITRVLERLPKSEATKRKEFLEKEWKEQTEQARTYGQHLIEKYRLEGVRLVSFPHFPDLFPEMANEYDTRLVTHVPSDLFARILEGEDIERIYSLGTSPGSFTRDADVFDSAAEWYAVKNYVRIETQASAGSEGFFKEKVYPKFTTGETVRDPVTGREAVRIELS